MISYLALFEGADDQRFGVGPFDTPGDAAEFGESVDEADVVVYTGYAARVMTPNVFGRYVAEVKLRSLEVPPAEGRRWIGEITQCRDDLPYGFITSAAGKSFFFSRVDDDGHDPDALVLGTRVSFTGSPLPSPGKRYPTAYMIRVVTANPPPDVVS